MSEKTGKSKLIIFSVVFIDLLGFGVMIPMLPFFVRHFGEDALHLGWLMFVYSFMQIFVSPIWGQLSDRIGRRPVLLLTIAGQALAFFWGGLSTTFMGLLLSRVFAGAFSANISTASAYMADITPKEERAKGMGLIGAAFGLGFIFGPAIGGLLIPYGYSWPSFFAAALCAINFVWAWFVLKEPKTNLEERRTNRRRLSLKVYRETIANPQLMFPILLFFLVTLAFTQLEVTFGLFVTDRFLFSERQAGMLFAGMGVVMAIVQGGLIGRIVKLWGERGAIRLGLPLIAFGLLGLIYSENIGLLFAGLGILSVGYSLTNPCLSALTSKAAPADHQGSVLGIYQSAGSVARVVGPPVAGYFYSQNQSGSFVVSLGVIFAAQLVFGISQWLSRDNP